MSTGIHIGTVKHDELKKTLTTWQLWGITVGFVISGECFGWRYGGWGSAGTLGCIITSLLAISVTIFTGGAGDWTKIASINDPLPQAMHYIVGNSSGGLHMLVWLGLFGLVASFHGIIIGYSRQIFALGRAGYWPAMFGQVHPRFRTPHWAILAGGIVGIAAIFSDELLIAGGQPLTANIVTMSVSGAILVYIISMIRLFRLRRLKPDMSRPCKAPFYPWFPAFSIAAAILCLAAMVYGNFGVALIFVGFLLIGYVYFRLPDHQRAVAPLDHEPIDQHTPSRRRFSTILPELKAPANV